jgi:hypothetical protein
MAQQDSPMPQTDTTPSPDLQQVELVVAEISQAKTHLARALKAFQTARRMGFVDYLTFSKDDMKNTGAEGTHVRTALEAIRHAGTHLESASRSTLDWTDPTPESIRISHALRQMKVEFRSLMITIRKQPNARHILKHLKRALAAAPITTTDSKR